MIEREAMHRLFVHGSAVTIDKVTKNTLKMYASHKDFMPTLIKISQGNTDMTGKKTFKLREDYLPMYDPYYYITEKDLSL
jgi:hypothetical protein